MGSDEGLIRVGSLVRSRFANYRDPGNPGIRRGIVWEVDSDFVRVFWDDKGSVELSREFVESALGTWWTVEVY